MDIESKELKEYINSSVVAIKAGLEGTGFEIVKPIEFDLAVTNTREGGGGLKIYIAKAEGKLKSEEISHMRFEARPKPQQPSASIYRPTYSGYNKRNPAR